MKESRSKEIASFSEQFMCIDKPETVSIRGNFEAPEAKLLQFYISRCTGRSDCKSDAEITEFIKGKYVALAYNLKRFSAHD